MFLSSKMQSILIIVVIFDKMQYKFKKAEVSEVSKKLIIAATNPLICYLIVKLIYTGLLLIIKVMFIIIKFEVPRETNWIYDRLAKLGRETISD